MGIDSKFNVSFIPVDVGDHSVEVFWNSSRENLSFQKVFLGSVTGWSH